LHRDLTYLRSSRKSSWNQCWSWSNWYWCWTLLDHHRDITHHGSRRGSLLHNWSRRGSLLLHHWKWGRSKDRLLHVLLLLRSIGSKHRMNRLGSLDLVVVRLRRYIK
jgi:hypothetical protein